MFYSNHPDLFLQKEMTDYTRAFTKLAVAELITAVLPEHSRSNVDRLLYAQEKEAEKYMITTAKDMMAIKKAAQAQVDAEFAVVEGIGMVNIATRESLYSFLTEVWLETKSCRFIRLGK